MLKKLGISKKPKALCFPSEESYPTPPMGYRVSFVDHLIRGLSAPIHPFLRGLLFIYEPSRTLVSLLLFLKVEKSEKTSINVTIKKLHPFDDEEEVPTLDVAPRTSTSHTLIVSETPVEGEESSPPQQNVVTTTPPSSPLAPSPKRTRVETIVEPTPQLGSSSNPLLDDPMIKELVRIGSQFIGYREYASRIEEKLAEANKLADTLAQKLERSETARKKAELDASKAKAEADEAKAKAASVEELQKKLEDAEAALNEHKAAQATREKGILKRLQNRRFLGFTARGP
ncbi:hypothetical protein QYE76_008776 [Lolium multiflorum]|uniref:Uncharacterized protein n=1 Tax=Lolium multiflorum TaxID=4521 RepID=A0AAD8TTX7_LOLMU|nr:hypothetical protein QYE76_008776 [Lolium multiflorum]